MSKPARRDPLSALSCGLRSLQPNLQSHFLCPVCLRSVHLNDRRAITDAHIIPKAAGGKMKTYLCGKCNNTFGTRQDKWFGEWLQFRASQESSFTNPCIKKSGFAIDDLSVNADIRKGRDGEIIFSMHERHNSPSTTKMISEKLRSKPSSIKIKFEIPLIRNIRSIKVGFLTAGYLMWFKALGYSWVLQDHLGQVRQQILRPDECLLEGDFVAWCHGVKWKRPWIGIATVFSEVALVFGFDNFLGLFPPMDRPDLYQTLGDDFSVGEVSNIKVFNFLDNPIYAEPMGVLFEDRLLIGPDAVFRDRVNASFIAFSYSADDGRLMRHVSKEEYDSFSHLPNAVKKNIDLNHVKPFWID